MALGRILFFALCALLSTIGFSQSDSLNREIRSFGVGSMSFSRQAEVPSYDQLSQTVKSGFAIPDTSQIAYDTALGNMSMVMLDVHFDLTPLVFRSDSVDSTQLWKQRVRIVGGFGAGRGTFDMFRARFIADSARGDTEVYYNNTFERFRAYGRAEYLWLNKRIIKGYVGVKVGLDRDISSFLRSYDVLPTQEISPNRNEARQYNFGHKQTSFLLGFPIGFELIMRQSVGLYLDVYPELTVSKVNGMKVTGMGTAVQFGLNFTVK